MPFLRGACAIILCLLVFPVSAHHAFEAEYDSTKPVSVKGKVKQVKWQHPHIWIHVEVEEEHGKKTEWRFWEASPTELAKQGVDEEVLKPGDEVKVYGFQARDGSPKASAGLITYADGTRVFSPPENKHGTR